MDDADDDEADGTAKNDQGGLWKAIESLGGSS